MNRRWAALQAAAFGRTLPPWRGSYYWRPAFKPSASDAWMADHCRHWSTTTPPSRMPDGMGVERWLALADGMKTARAARCRPGGEYEYEWEAAIRWSQRLAHSSTCRNAGGLILRVRDGYGSGPAAVAALTPTHGIEPWRIRQCRWCDADMYVQSSVRLDPSARVQCESDECVAVVC